MQRQIDRLTALLNRPIEALGYVLWGIELTGDTRGSLLRVYIDSDDGVDVHDCEVVSHQVSGILDVEDPLPGEYTLEVSSPGINRPLFTEEQFRMYVGENVRIHTQVPLLGRRNFRGRLLDCQDGRVRLQGDGGEPWDLELASVNAAHLDPEIRIGRG